MEISMTLSYFKRICVSIQFPITYLNSDNINLKKWHDYSTTISRQVDVQY